MGMAILALSLNMGRVAISADSIDLFMKSAQATFGAFAVLSFCGIFASTAGGGRERKPSAEGREGRRF